VSGARVAEVEGVATSMKEPDGSAERLRRLLRVTDVALAHVSVERLLDELLVRVREILDADTAAVLLLDRSTNELVATAAKGLEEEVVAGVRIPVGKGFAGRISAERRPLVLARVDHRNVLNPILLEKGIVSLLGVPMLVQGEAIGVLHVGTLRERTFADDDIQLLQLVAERVALALHVRLLERERLVTETLQQSLLPVALPSVPGLRLSSRYLPASTTDVVGGDWFDAFVLPSGALGVAIGDVAGRGVHAASVMGRVRNGLRAYAAEGDSPARVVTRLDRLVSLFDPGMIVTLLFGVVDADLAEFRFVAAGHLPPLLVTVDGPMFAENGERRNPPIGTGRPHAFVDEAVPIHIGTSVLLYTDGLVERRGESLTEGLERLRSAAVAIRDVRDPDEGIRSVLRALVSDRESSDDVALLLLRRDGTGTEFDLRIKGQARELVVIRRALRRWLDDLGVRRQDRDDIVTAVGEASANAVGHAYGPAGGWVHVAGTLTDGTVELSIRDRGRWRRKRPNRGGRGVTLMENTMDSVEFARSSGGTVVTLRRRVETA
jgi:serine phosphatase RsbU (regulator of sigma subunit)/anti-sigma regulatory factor (Ser/Thr protein kinase)